MNQYAIAYNNKNGTGFSNIEPYIQNNVESLEDAKRQAHDLVQGGYKRVTIFSYDTEKVPEIITWWYVGLHNPIKIGK
jgi:hypothetical protein